MALLFGLFTPGFGLFAADDLWRQARAAADIHRLSTLFSAQDVAHRLDSETGLDQAIDWCRRTAVTKVYLEEFRDGYQAQRDVLLKAKSRFDAAGFQTAGCVTTTRLGKPSSGYKTVSCYTDAATLSQLQAIFEYAASLFDEIMIDDFWFTDCTCAECDAARRAQVVAIGDKHFPVAGDSWEEYRRELMFRVSQERVLGPAKRVNPRVRVIIKYPQWYDRFHERGYDVLGETRIFDRIWVGTETRDYTDKRWGGTVQYEGYFIMRWLEDIGQAKTGGGWYDWLGTTEKTYLEQARQTVLAGARESLLFCYGGLQGSTGPADVAALRKEIPELLEVAKEVRTRRVVGLAAYKPANSHPENEARVFDFVGMLGLPLVPCHEFPSNAPAAFFSVHALKQPRLSDTLADWIESGKAALVTDGLAARLPEHLKLGRPNVRILPVHGDPKSLLEMPRSDLDSLRAWALHPFATTLSAPNRLAFCLFSDGSWVLQNFGESPARAEINGSAVTLPARAWTYHWAGP